MAVFRVERNTGYTVMSNHHLRNKELSLKAKGLLSQMLSLPEDWDYTLAGLSYINRESIDAIRTAVWELEKAGYITRRQGRDEKGKMTAIEYTIYEQPQPPELDCPVLENPTADNPILENPTTDNPTSENPMQLNKDISRTNLPKKEKSNTDLSITHSIPIHSLNPLPYGEDEAAQPPERKRAERNDAYRVYEEIIKDNIAYDILLQDRSLDRDRLNEIVDLMLETVCTARKKIRIAGDDYPAELVKSKFMKLSSEHIRFVLDCMQEKEILIGAINGNLSTMFGDVNEKVGTIAAEVGKTPQGWNAGIFSMIQSLSENVIVPIAGLVITYVLCVELISMITEKNNMHDIDTFMFFKWFFKAWVAVYLVTHTFTITMAVFDMAQHVVSGAAGVIGGDTNIDVDAALSSMQAGLDAMEIPELLLLVMETSLVSLCMKIMSVLITVILYGRMIEIYLYCSVSPIPFATMTNREWGQIGNNYLKALFALGFQGFLIMICVGIYAVLIGSMIVADNLHSAIFSLAAYTVILCFSLFKTGALAKSIFNAH